MNELLYIYIEIFDIDENLKEYEFLYKQETNRTDTTMMK